jgi:DnaK suppressor protein
MKPEDARELLARERRRIEEALRGLEPDLPTEEQDDTSPADLGSELFEEERDEGLRDQLQGELAAVERAERRLEDGTYGRSIESGEPIPDARLEAVPWAERTVEEEERAERA